MIEFDEEIGRINRIRILSRRDERALIASLPETSVHRLSRSAVDCSRLAEQWGGGGHKAAAGAFVAGPLAEVQPQVLSAVRQAMQ